MQAALHNLRGVRKELIIAKRDRDRNMESLELQQVRYRKLELELAEEKEKARTLQAQLDRSREDIISDFQKSADFEDILNKEYDANFPETFKTCWEQIVEEIGGTIPGVNLQAFPVPKIPGLEGSQGASKEQPKESIAQSPTPDRSLSPVREVIDFAPSPKEDPLPFQPAVDPTTEEAKEGPFEDVDVVE